MKLDKIKLHRLLSEKGITHLHHANTVATALTFIKKKGLLSRGAIERQQLYQTPQSSDRKDKLLNIWNDVFLDTHDLHQHFKRQNHYGPVLFKFSIDFLLNTKAEIWITKDNPIRWTRFMRNSEKYFRSVSELNKTWNEYKREKRMITIRNNSRAILFKFLSEIILDDPKLLIEDVDIYKKALRTLQTEAKINTPKIKIKTRNCPSFCFCESNYLEDVSIRDLERYFSPKGF